MTLKLTLAALAVLALGAAPAAALSPGRLTSLTPERVLDRTRVIEDPLEFTTVITTEPAARSRTRVGASWNDNHLRAVIDKRSGQVRFEVRQALQYYGPFRDFRRVNYLAPDGLVVADLQRSSEPRDNCMFPDVTGCSQREDVAFEVDEATLRAAAGGYQPGSAGAWTFKFKGQTGVDQVSQVAQAEIAGLMRALDAYRPR